MMLPLYAAAKRAARFTRDAYDAAAGMFDVGLQSLTLAAIRRRH